MWFAISCSVISDKEHADLLQEKIFHLSRGLTDKERDWIFDGGLKWMEENWTE